MGNQFGSFRPPINPVNAGLKGGLKSGEGVMEREFLLKMKQTDSVGEADEWKVKIYPHG